MSDSPMDQQSMFSMPSVETRLAIVEKKLTDHNDTFRSIGESIAKLTEISSTLKSLIAVHESKIQQGEQIKSTIFELIDKRKEDTDRGLDRANQRIEELNTQIRAHIRDEINEHYQELKVMLEDLKQSQKEVNEKIDKKFVESDKSNKEEMKELGERVTALERWRWLMLGAGTVIGLLLSKFAAFGSVLKLFSN